MAYIDDERRRRNRAGVNLTPEQEDWLARANIAQSRGLPVPPRPVEGEAGNQRLSPAYTDPRSQSIANSPIRPVRSMLDRIFSPGRADAANQMNREYKENALTSQLGRSGQRIEQDYNKARTTSMMTSNKMEALKERAMSGKDPKALELLKAYTAAIGKGGGIPPWGDPLRDGDKGSATKNGSDTPKPPPAAARGDLTSVQNRVRIQQRAAEIDELIEQQQQIVDRKPQRVRRQASGRDWRPNMPEYTDIPFENSYSADDIKNAPLKLKALQQEKQQLEQVLTEISGPLTSPGGPEMGSPNRSTVDR